jgi:hypothetical protein
MGDSLVPEPFECQQRWACLGCHKCNPSLYPYPEDSTRRRPMPATPVPTRKCRLCDTYVIERSDGKPGYIHAQDDWDCKVLAETLIEADTYVSEPGAPGFDYCTHDEQPDYCDGCLYLRQKHAGSVAARVKVAVRLIDAITKDEPAYPTVARADLIAVRDVLTGKSE